MSRGREGPLYGHRRDGRAGIRIPDGLIHCERESRRLLEIHQALDPGPRDRRRLSPCL